MLTALAHPITNLIPNPGTAPQNSLHDPDATRRPGPPRLFFRSRPPTFHHPPNHRQQPPGTRRQSPYHPPMTSQSHPENPKTTDTAQRPTIAVSMGDPGGIGPEVTLKALADPNRRAAARWIIYGSQSALINAANLASINPFWWRTTPESALAPTASAHQVLLIDRDQSRPPETGNWRHEPTRDGGLASFTYIEDALADAARTLRSRDHPHAPPQSTPDCLGAHLHIDAITTAPISKEAWSLAGKAKWPGHTELLADRLNAKDARMIFVSPLLIVALATTHIPLTQVADQLSLGRVLTTIEQAHRTCQNLGIKEPRIAVTGLNPHAGEQGILGADEERVITPAINHAKRQGIQATGPHPADTVFSAALRHSNHDLPKAPRRHDAVVAMYHDQGLVPVKLLGFDQAVNLTAGLPTPRTSPDHGTAFDIAHNGAANPGSMAAALDLAVKLAMNTPTTANNPNTHRTQTA